MNIRFPNNVTKTAICATLGYAGAAIINLASAARVIAPINGALCLGGIALSEKLIYSIIRRVNSPFMGRANSFSKAIEKNASYSLAAYSTLRIMQAAGLICSVPLIVKIAAIAAPILLIGTIIKQAYKINPELETVEVSEPVISQGENPVKFSEQIKLHLQSTEFANKVFGVKFKGKNRMVRFICNPQGTTISIPAKAGRTKEISQQYCLVTDNWLPKNLAVKIRSIIFKAIEKSNYTLAILDCTKDGVLPINIV